MKDSDVNVGILIAYSPAANLDELQDFARRMVQDVTKELIDATNMEWNFHIEEPSSLSDDNPRGPSDFLDEASLRMVEGPFDIVLVVTDVALYSRPRAVVA